MRFIKLAILSAVILSLIIFCISSLIPSQVRISRAVDIQVSKDSLVAAVADLRTWKQWNELVQDSESITQQFTSASIATHKVKILKQVQTGDTLFTSWQQQNARMLSSGFTWYGNTGHLVLQWYFDIPVRWYPWEKFGSILFDKQLGPPMEKSLGNLKKLLEKNPQ